MAKFNIEVELDWLEDADVDGVLREEIIAGIQQRLTENVEKKAKQQLAEKLSEKVETVVDEFLQKVTSNKIEKILIPHKTSSWGSEVEMVPISEFIGKRFEAMATEEKYDGKGNEYRRYDSKGGPYSLIEYLTKGYIAEELNEKVVTMIKQAKTQAEQTLIKSLEENLQQQLNADMLQRLNIPELLKNLQNTIEAPK